MNGMHTTCPSCHAVFRVTPEQLEVRGGKVRCGKCAFVFNAFETLVTPIETVSLMAPPVEEERATEEDVVEEHITLQPAPPTVAEPLTGSFPIPTDDQIDREAEEINRRIAETAHAESLREEKKQVEPAREEVAEEETASESAAEQPDAKPARPKLEITPDLQQKLQNLQDELNTTEKRARWHRLGWGLGVLVLLALVLGQTAYFKRDALAARYPEMKPALESFCQLLQCQIGLMADVGQIKLDASDLQSDSEQPGKFTLSATLRNLAPYRQAYPNLELTLTDASNQPLARRHFKPEEYLSKDEPSEQGMPSNEEVLVKLPLELVNINAVGYKLFVYYP